MKVIYIKNNTQYFLKNNKLYVTDFFLKSIPLTKRLYSNECLFTFLYNIEFNYTTFQNTYNIATVFNTKNKKFPYYIMCFDYDIIINNYLDSPLIRIEKLNKIIDNIKYEKNN